VDSRKGSGSRRHPRPRDLVCNMNFVSIFVNCSRTFSYLCEMPPPTFLGHRSLCKVWILLECQPRTYVLLL
jgi:hypothetical protein